MAVAIFHDDIMNRVSIAGPGDQFDLHMFKALVDTGATTTCITKTAADKVGLLPVGKVPVQGVSGVSFHDTYVFKVAFAFEAIGTEPDMPVASVQIFDFPIEGADLNLEQSQFDVLLGMDIISRGSLKIDGDGSFSFCF